MTAGRKLFIGLVAGLAAAMLAILLVATQAPAAGAAPDWSPMLVTDTHTVLTPSTIRRSPGLTVTTTAAVTDGHKFANTGKTFVEVVNGSAGVVTVTFAVPVLVDGLPVTSLAVPVGAGVTKLVGPFPVNLYNQGASDSLNMVYMDYSTITTVTVAAFTLPQN